MLNLPLIYEKRQCGYPSLLAQVAQPPARLEQARQIEHAMNEDREARERLLRGEPAARPAAPAVRIDDAGVGVRPVSADSPTGR